MTLSMHDARPKSLHWPAVLRALRTCSGEYVLVRDGKATEPAGSVSVRPAAKGTELCLFPGETPAARLDLIGTLDELAKHGGRRFMAAARAKAGASFLLVESVGDEQLDDGIFAVVRTRRPSLAYNQSQQSGASTTLRSKRIK